MPETNDGEATWEEIQITIQTKAGPVVVPALRHKTLGAGLAVTGYRFGYFTVTHIATGHTASQAQYERCANAMRNLLDLAPIADWTLDAEAVKAHCTARMHEDVGFGAILNDARRVDHLWYDEFPWEDATVDPWTMLRTREDELLPAQDQPVLSPPQETPKR